MEGGGGATRFCLLSISFFPAMVTLVWGGGVLLWSSAVLIPPCPPPPQCYGIQMRVHDRCRRGTSPPPTVYGQSNTSLPPPPRPPGGLSPGDTPTRQHTGGTGAPPPHPHPHSHPRRVLRGKEQRRKAKVKENALQICHGRHPCKKKKDKSTPPKEL